ncbi:MAG: hypothetical protein HYZ28_13330 [Myxococcales bacterium]|nr:hypothetical protein [Myxococcales bacterium]
MGVPETGTACSRTSGEVRAQARGRPFRSLGLIAALPLAASCGGPPHRKDEARLSYRAAFTAEPGVNAKVIFPFPNDGAQLSVEQGLSVSDGGTARLESTPEGMGLAVEGKGQVEAAFAQERVKGLPAGEGVPEASVSRPVPDGGTGDRYFRVNKGGSASIQVDFEYSATRECGPMCGGKRSWTYRGPVGLSLQEVQTSFTEERGR